MAQLVIALSPRMRKVGCSNSSRDRPTSLIETSRASFTTKRSTTGMNPRGSRRWPYVPCHSNCYTLMAMNAEQVSKFQTLYFTHNQIYPFKINPVNKDRRELHVYCECNLNTSHDSSANMLCNSCIFKLVISAI